MSNSILTPAILEAVDTFKKADSRITGAITSRANAQRTQAVVAYGIGSTVAQYLTEDEVTLEVAEKALGLDRAKVDRIARMGRLTKGLDASAVDVDNEETMADLTKVWLKVSSSKGIPVATIDRIGAKRFGTVAGLKEAVDAATQAEVTLAKVLKALTKAAEALQDFDLSLASDEEQASFEAAFDLIAAFDGTREAEAA